MISRIDSNNDGTIDIKEIEDMLKVKESELEMEAFFNLLDDDHNDKITAPEFCKAVAAPRPQHHRFGSGAVLLGL